MLTHSHITRHYRLFSLVLSLTTVVVCGLSRPVCAQPESLSQLEERAFQQAVAAADPSIVRIETVGGLDLVGDVLTAAGPTTGVIVSADGDIITSRFNFISKPATIVVTLADERKLPAVVVAEDLSRMLTLLRVDATGLTPLHPADLNTVQVGSWSLALGRTFDPVFPNLSVGIISAVKRLNGRALQTDAKVSPLNYGGPLIDLEGHGLGILVPLSPQDDNETAGIEWYDGGIGFAIPLTDIYAVLPRLQAGESLKRGLIGVQFKQEGPLAGEARVLGVRPESPGDKAGLVEGDLIVAVDGEQTPRVPLLKRALGRRYAGETVVLSVQRGETFIDVSVELAAELRPYEFPYLGILPVRAPLMSEATGVEIRQVLPGTPAEQLKLQPGDIIQTVRETRITNVESLHAALRGLRPGDDCSLTVQRGTNPQTLNISLATLSTTVPDALEPVVLPRGDENVVRPPVGRISETLPGRELKYWAYIPENLQPSRPLGLMVWVHPGGDPLEAELLRLCRSECDLRGIMLVGPQAGDIAGWSADDAEAITDLVRAMQKTYPVDPQRIAICGFDDAVDFSVPLAFKNRDLFHGVMAVGGVSRRPLPDNDPDYRMQLHLTAFEQDPDHELVEKFALICEAAKYPVARLALPGVKANGLTPEWASAVLRWLDALDRI